MLKWFNKKKKDNKGFTLVELVIVVAILAILVGLLAPQYTKYVEKSRKSADANNLEEIVKQIKVTASDPSYIIPEGEFVVVMTTEGTSITFTKKDGADDSAVTTTNSWKASLNTLLEYDWDSDTDTNSMTSEGLKLKSSKWPVGVAGNEASIGTDEHAIGAQIVVDDDGTMEVTYVPNTIKEGTF